MPPKGLAPKTDIGKKDAKRKAKKEKLAKHLNDQAREQKMAERDAEEAKVPGLMGSKLQELLLQIQKGEVEENVDDSRKRIGPQEEKRKAIHQMQNLLVDPHFVSNPAGAFSAMDAILNSKIAQAKQQQK